MQVTGPLFPGCLFVSLVLGADDPAPIRSTGGCIGLGRFGQTYTPAPLIAATRGESEGATNALLSFIFGDKVRRIAGPFTGIVAVFAMPQGADHVQVILTLLAKVQRLTVHQDDPIH